MSKGLFGLIVKTQIKDAERRLKSDFIISTEGAKTKTYLQVGNMIYYILNKKI